VPNGVKKRKSFVKISLHKKTSVQYCGLKNGRYNVDIREKERKGKEMKTQGIKHSRSTNRLNFAGLHNANVPVKFRIIVSSPDGRVYDRGVCYGADVQSARSWLPSDITRLGDIHLQREEN